jgi:hypothetical protein
MGLQPMSAKRMAAIRGKPPRATWADATVGDKGRNAAG